NMGSNRAQAREARTSDKPAALSRSHTPARISASPSPATAACTIQAVISRAPIALMARAPVVIGWSLRSLQVIANAIRDIDRKSEGDASPLQTSGLRKFSTLHSR